MVTGMIIRPARPDDRPAMERICAQTWEWGDYIPEVWDDWLADEQGLLVVGDIDGQVVALTRFRFQTPGEIWLEGMRVDPKYRSRGIGRQFLEYCIAYSREHGARVVRLSTSYRNIPAQTLITQVGMVRVGAYQFWLADPLPGSPDPVFLSTEHGDQVRAFLAGSPVLAHTRGLHGIDWACQELSSPSIDQFLAAGQFAAQLTADGQLDALAILHSRPEDSELWISFIDGQASAIVSLATAIRGYAARIGAEKAQLMTPHLGWLRGALSEAGYAIGEWEGELWVFELRFSGQALAPGGGHSDD